MLLLKIYQYLIFVNKQSKKMLNTDFKYFERTNAVQTKEKVS